MWVSGNPWTKINQQHTSSLALPVRSMFDGRLSHTQPGLLRACYSSWWPSWTAVSSTHLAAVFGRKYSTVTQGFTTTKKVKMYSIHPKPVEREPWDCGFCCIVVLPTKYGLPRVAGSDQWGGLVSVLWIFWTPFRCHGSNSVEAADRSHQCQGQGCPVWVEFTHYKYLKGRFNNSNIL